MCQLVFASTLQTRPRHAVDDRINGYGPILLCTETKRLFVQKVLENGQMVTRIVRESDYSPPAALFITALIHFQRFIGAKAEVR